jgi:hypothetical protein
MGGAIADAIMEYHNQIRSNSTGLSAKVPPAVASTGENPKAVPDAPQDLKKAVEADVAAQKAGVPPGDKTAEAVVVSELPKEKKAQPSADKAENRSGKENDLQTNSPEKLPTTQSSNSTTAVAQDALASGATLKTAAETTPVTSSKESTNKTTSPAEQTSQITGANTVSEAAEQEAQRTAEAIEEKTRPSTEATDTGVKKALTEKSGVFFKVQLMAVSKDIPLTPSNFKGLNTLSKEPVNSMYRILYGNTPSYEQAKLLQAGARQKGYEQAYIVAYKDGERIAVDKALSYLSN